MGIKSVTLEGLCYLLKKCKGNARLGFIYIHDFQISNMKSRCNLSAMFIANLLYFLKPVSFNLFVYNSPLRPLKVFALYEIHIRYYI